MAVVTSQNVKLANKRRNAVSKQKHRGSSAGSAPSRRDSGRQQQQQARKRRRGAAAVGARAEHSQPAVDSGHIDDIASALLMDEGADNDEGADSDRSEESSESDVADFEAAPRRFAQHADSKQQRMPVRPPTGDWTDSAEAQTRNRQLQWLNRHSQPHTQPRHQHQLPQLTAEEGADGMEQETDRAEEEEGEAYRSAGERQQPATTPSADGPLQSAEDIRRQRQRRVTPAQTHTHTRTHTLKHTHTHRDSLTEGINPRRKQSAPARS